MALKIDTNFTRKLTCAFKNETRDLVNFHRLKNSDFILESKMDSIKIKIETTRSIRCSEKTYFSLGISE